MLASLGLRVWSVTPKWDKKMGEQGPLVESHYCTESYGFLPCSDRRGGSISLMIIYGYILLMGANVLSEGSEMLLQILHPGIIGGLVLPVLGALPDSLIIFVAGYGVEEKPEKVAEEVNVGMGTLAGSTVMLLTIAYGGGILLGRCDRNPTNGHMKEKTLTNRWDFIHTGVTVDASLTKNANIMLISTALYLTVQIPHAFGVKDLRVAALVGAFICFAGVVAYAVYQILQPAMQQRRMEAARILGQRSAALSGMAVKYGALLTNAGSVDSEVLDRIFHEVDNDNSG